MQLPQWLARFNRRVTNPVQRLWAGWLPGTGILDHVGRKSGTRYRTPLNVFPTDDGVAVLLTYGPDRDWLKNITAAGGARVQRMGRTVDLTGPRVMPKAEAATYVSGMSRLIFPRLPFDSAVLLTHRPTFVAEQCQQRFVGAREPPERDSRPESGGANSQRTTV